MKQKIGKNLNGRDVKVRETQPKRRKCDVEGCKECKYLKYFEKLLNDECESSDERLNGHA